MGRPRRHKPNDLKTIHDRRTTDKRLKNVLLEPDEIADPFGMELGETVVVMRQIRGDPLGALKARRSIGEAQYQGGRTFQLDFETAERGPRAIDPSKEFVDGGLMPEPITEGQRKAVVRLNLVHKELGQNGSALIHAVLIERKTIDRICSDRMLTTQRENDYIGHRFRECLTELAIFYGFATREKR